METFILMFLIMLGSLLAGTVVLHIIPMLGDLGEALAEKLCRAPLLDVLITYFTVTPLIVGPIIAGWLGLAAAVVAQVLGTVIW